MSYSPEWFGKSLRPPRIKAEKDPSVPEPPEPSQPTVTSSETAPSGALPVDAAGGGGGEVPDNAPGSSAAPSAAPADVTPPSTRPVVPASEFVWEVEERGEESQEVASNTQQETSQENESRSVASVFEAMLDDALAAPEDQAAKDRIADVLYDAGEEEMGDNLRQRSRLLETVLRTRVVPDDPELEGLREDAVTDVLVAVPPEIQALWAVGISQVLLAENPLGPELLGGLSWPQGWSPERFTTALQDILNAYAYNAYGVGLQRWLDSALEEGRAALAALRTTQQGSRNFTQGIDRELPRWRDVAAFRYGIDQFLSLLTLAAGEQSKNPSPPLIQSLLDPSHTAWGDWAPDRGEMLFYLVRELAAADAYLTAAGEGTSLVLSDYTEDADWIEGDDNFEVETFHNILHGREGRVISLSASLARGLIELSGG